MKKIIKKATNYISRNRFKLFIILAVLFVGIIAGWLLSRSQQVSQVQKQTASEELIAKTTIDAQKLARKSDIEGAVKKYDDVINSTDDSYQKSILIINKAVIYINTDDYSKALEIAKSAEQIDANFTVLRITAEIYEKLGENKMAVEYYQRAIPLIDTTDPMAEDDRIYYQSLVEELSKND